MGKLDKTCNSCFRRHDLVRRAVVCRIAGPSKQRRLTLRCDLRFLPQIPGNEAFLPVLCLPIPPGSCVVVMGTGIDHRMIGVVIERQIHVLFSCIERELQDLHARISGLFHQILHFLRQITQILSDALKVPQLLAQRAEQFHSRTLLPVPVCRLFGLRGDHIIRLKPPHVIEAHHIKKPQLLADPADPPGEALRAVRVPVIHWITPALSLRRKGIRRSARFKGAAAVFIKLVQLRIRPAIRALISSVVRNIPNELDGFCMGVLFHLVPLYEEFILCPPIIIDLLREFHRPGSKLPGVSGPQALVPQGPVAFAEVLGQTFV